jgi:hypothetical protein
VERAGERIETAVRREGQGKGFKELKWLKQLKEFK